MTPGQKLIAEKIIKLYKEDDGFLDWTVLLEKGAYLFRDNIGHEERFKQQELIKSGLLDFGLIEITSKTGDKSRLTEKGFKFKSFKKTERQEKIISFPKRYWYVVAIVAFLLGDTFSPLRTLLWQKILPGTSQSTPAIPEKADTNVNHKMNLPSDSLSTNLKRIK